MPLAFILKDSEPTSQAHALIRNHTYGPSLCWTTLNQLSHTGQGVRCGVGGAFVTAWQPPELSTVISDQFPLPPSLPVVRTNSLSAPTRLAWPKRIGTFAKWDLELVREPAVGRRRGQDGHKRATEKTRGGDKGAEKCEGCFRLGGGEIEGAGRR